MSTSETTPAESLDAGALLALGLLGAGLAVGAGAVLRNPKNRAVLARVMRDLGLPELGREMLGDLLVNLGTSFTGQRAIGRTPRSTPLA